MVNSGSGFQRLKGRMGVKMSATYRVFLKILEEDGFHTESKHCQIQKVENVFTEAKVFYLTSTAMFGGSEQEPRKIGVQEKLSLPFKTCFFECPQGSSWNIRYLDQTTGEAKGFIRFCGVFVHETSPKIYTLNILAYDEARKDFYVFYPEEKQLQSLFIGWVEAVCQFLGSAAIGTATDRQSIKVGTGSNKKTLRIGKFFVVGKKSMRDTQPSEIPFSIDWSHRWRVRGHWRNLPNRVGKDREGLPIPNFTWVEDYVKGPEGKDLIEKIRVIKPDSL